MENRIYNDFLLESKNVLLYTLGLSYPQLASNSTKTPLEDALKATIENCLPLLSRAFEKELDPINYFGEYTLRSGTANGKAASPSLACLYSWEYINPFWSRIFKYHCLLSVYDRLHEYLFLDSQPIPVYSFLRYFRRAGLDYVIKHHPKFSLKPEEPSKPAKSKTLPKSASSPVADEKAPLSDNKISSNAKMEKNSSYKKDGLSFNKNQKNISSSGSASSKRKEDKPPYEFMEVSTKCSAFSDSFKRRFLSTSNYFNEYSEKLNMLISPEIISVFLLDKKERKENILHSLRIKQNNIVLTQQLCRNHIHLDNILKAISNLTDNSCDDGQILSFIQSANIFLQHPLPATDKNDIPHRNRAEESTKDNADKSEQSPAKSSVNKNKKTKNEEQEEPDKVFLENSDRIYYFYKIEQLFSFNLINCLVQNIERMRDGNPLQRNLVEILGLYDILSACFLLPNLLSRHFLVQFAFDSLNEYMDFDSNCLTKLIHERNVIASFIDDSKTLVQTNLALTKWHNCFLNFIDYLTVILFPAFENYFFIRLYEQIKELKSAEPVNDKQAENPEPEKDTQDGSSSSEKNEQEGEAPSAENKHGKMPAPEKNNQTEGPAPEKDTQAESPAAKCDRQAETSSQENKQAESSASEKDTQTEGTVPEEDAQNKKAEKISSEKEPQAKNPVSEMDIFKDMYLLISAYLSDEKNYNEIQNFSADITKVFNSNPLKKGPDMCEDYIIKNDYEERANSIGKFMNGLEGCGVKKRTKVAYTLQETGIDTDIYRQVISAFHRKKGNAQTPFLSRQYMIDHFAGKNNDFYREKMKQTFVSALFHSF